MIKPYDWQQPRVDRLVEILRNHNAALDASATGTGKTVVALAVANTLNLNPLVVAPKSVITMWHEMSRSMNVKLMDVVNLEKLKTGKTQWLKKNGPKTFKWNLPADGFIILDECHKVSGQDTLNSRMLAMAKVQKLKVLTMSATPFDSPLKMRTLGYLYGLHNYNTADFWRFCRAHGCQPAIFHRGLEFPKGAGAKKHLAKLHAEIAHLMVRQTIDEIPGFPENQIYCDLYDLAKDYTAEINSIESEFTGVLKDKPKSAIEAQIRARQKTELYKVPLLIDLAEDMLAEGCSVVIFVTFRETVAQLVRGLHRHDISTIIGGQSPNERDGELARFQTDQSTVCVATIQSGGQSVNLHHTETSVRPRRTLITPNFSAVDFTQCFGRIHRATALSKSIQRIILAAGTVEEKNVYPAVQRKLGNISTLVDGDLSGL